MMIMITIMSIIITIIIIIIIIIIITIIKHVDLGGLSSRSKVSGFKPGRGLWIFSGHKNPEYKSSGKDFNQRVPNLKFQAR